MPQRNIPCCGTGGSNCAHPTHWASSKRVPAIIFATLLRRACTNDSSRGAQTLTNAGQRGVHAIKCSRTPRLEEETADGMCASFGEPGGRVVDVGMPEQQHASTGKERVQPFPSNTQGQSLHPKHENRKRRQVTAPHPLQGENMSPGIPSRLKQC